MEEVLLRRVAEKEEKNPSKKSCREGRSMEEVFVAENVRRRKVVEKRNCRSEEESSFKSYCTVKI